MTRSLLTRLPRRWRVGTAAVIATAAVVSLAAPALATPAPRPVSWGAKVTVNPYQDDAASARGYNALWGVRHTPETPSVAVSAIRAPLPVPNATIPGDANSVLLRKVMNTSLKYTLTTWWQQHFGSQTNTPLLDLGGTDETHVRGPAMEAYALAIALRTDSYSPTLTGVPAATAQLAAVKLVTALAKSHVSNAVHGWGRVWQSPLWAAQAGTAGWLLWDKLDNSTRLAVVKMVANEAGQFVNYPVPYYQAFDGTVLSPGDTKAEEDSWDSMILQLALAMMPTSVQVSAWAQKNVELLLASYSRPSDLSSNTVINGQPLADWLHGSNINENGTLVNHRIVHPDYMATVVQSLTAPLVAGMAGTPTPVAALHDADVVYGALTTLDFTAPPWRAPGGNIYVPGTGNLYYPQSDDWGTGRIAHMVAFDEMSADLHTAGLAATAATTELKLHLQRVATMQARSADGRSYVSASEDTYNLREEWVAYHLSLAWLSKWTTANGLVSFTNASVLTAAG